MKVSTLIEQLSRLEPDALVVMAQDSEGNGFSPLDEIDSSLYIALDRSSGFLYDPEEEVEDDYEIEDSVPAVVLWPLR